MLAFQAKDPIALALPESGNTSAIQVALRSIRTHLGMEVAYVSEFVGDRTVFRQVDAPGLEDLIKVGDSHSLDDVYCRHILDGRLPNLMGDTNAVAFAAAMPITRAVPIGKHMSIPLRLADGEVYGMFCCLGPNADTSLNERDLNTMRVFADFAAHEVQRDVEARRLTQSKLQRITQVMADGEMSAVYQPIVSIQKGRIVGFESLTRFRSTPYRTPDIWFKEAGEVDRGAILEIAAIKLALQALPYLPADIYLTVNASPATVVAREFPSAFEGVALERIVLEVTEHAVVEDYVSLMRAVDGLRTRGVRLAVDDAGAGYSGLQHILRLRPDLIKLDLSLTRNINQDVARRALAAALVNFSVATDSEVVAEGVETAEEMDALRDLGVQKAQGYYLGKPSPFSEALCSVQYGRAWSPARAAGSAEPQGRQASPAACELCALEYGRP